MLLGIIDVLLKASHVLSGVVALVCGGAAIGLAKGQRWHKRAGRCYVYAMLWITISSVGLLAIRPNIFLLGVALLTGYLSLTGYRVTPAANRNKAISWSRRIDLIIAIGGILVGIGMIGWSAANLTGLQITLVKSSPNGPLISVPFGFLALNVFFGAMLLVNAIPDALKVVRPPTDSRWWWFAHMNRMIGGYIGALSAFLVQNVSTYVPINWSWMIWIAPTVIGLPLLSVWIRRYRQRFALEDTTAK